MGRAKFSMRPTFTALCLTLNGCHTAAPCTPNIEPTTPNSTRVDVSATHEDVQGEGVPTSSCAAPADLGVRLIGRYDGCQRGGIRAAWSGTGFVARFTGTGIGATFEGPAVTYTVVVDDTTIGELSTTGPGKYALVSGLPKGEHVVVLSRQGEASFGATTLTAISVVDGALLSPPPAPSRRIEVVGDSITAGYGNEGAAPNCAFSAETENHYLTYGALLARELRAELSTVAWSGKGVVSNYAGNRDEPMPVLYDRADATNAQSVWNYSSWQADAVIVNLGTNDYSTDNDPRDTEFVLAYAQLLATVRIRYPVAHIVCTVGPLLSGSDLAKAESNIRAAIANRTRAGDSRVTFHSMRVANANPGCDWHPGLSTHAAMARDLLPTVQRLMHW